VLEGEEAAAALRILREDSERAYDRYQALLNLDDAGRPIDAERRGLARELARMNLSLNFYTQWYWKTDLHNLLNFLSLRADAHAQYEIRAYAEAMLDTVKRWVPWTFEAFEQYRLRGINLSERGWAVVKKLIAGESVDQPASGLGKREWRELMQLLGREV
jgi:thymidylate synthase (FAD)